MRFLEILSLLVVVAISLSIGSVPRLRNWWHRQMKSDVKPGPANVGDFIGLTSLALTIVAVFIGWYSIHLQVERSDIETRVKGVDEANGSLLRGLTDLRANYQALSSSDVDIHLQYPTDDVRVISDSLPELHWKYARHGKGIDYVLQVVRLDTPAESTSPNSAGSEGEGFQMSEPRVCHFTQLRQCTFRATYPNAESSPIPAANDSGSPGALQGHYLWRVSPINAAFKGRNESDQAVLRWSEYGSFCFYESPPVPRDCVDSLNQGSSSTDQGPKTSRTAVLVGTNYSDNVNFSWIRYGERGGHDVALIKLLIEHCVAWDGRAFVFEEKRCYTEAEAYRRDPKTLESPPKYALTVMFKSYDTVLAGLESLSRREIDVFIGSLTRAAERENQQIRLTDGYYSFHTALLVPGLLTNTSFSSWLSSDRTIGVIQGSTNEWLAKELAGSVSGGRIALISFPSLASMKEAVHSGQLQGVIVDSVLKNGFGEVTEISLATTAALHRYMERLGTDQEQFTIASGVEGDSKDEARRRRSEGTEVKTSVAGLSLYTSLQRALRSPAVQDVLPCIRARNQLPVDLEHSADGQGETKDNEGLQAAAERIGCVTGKM